MDELKDVWKILGIVVLISGVITSTVLVLGFVNCSNNCGIADIDCKANCIFWMVENHPAVAEAKDIAEQCNSSDVNCLKAVGTKVLSDKAEEDATR